MEAEAASAHGRSTRCANRSAGARGAFVGQLTALAGLRDARSAAGRAKPTATPRRGRSSSANLPLRPRERGPTTVSRTLSKRVALASYVVALRLVRKPPLLGALAALTRRGDACRPHRRSPELSTLADDVEGGVGDGDDLLSGLGVGQAKAAVVAGPPASDDVGERIFLSVKAEPQGPVLGVLEDLDRRSLASGGAPPERH